MAPRQKGKELRHFGRAMPLALVVSLLISAVALADDLKVDLASTPTDTTIAEGESTTAEYFLTAQKDAGEPTTGQPTCNASSAQPLNVTIVSSPATGLTVNPNPVQLTGCGGSNSVSATFTGNAAGTYNLTATTSGGNGNSVDVTLAAWTLTVEEGTSAPSDTTPPIIGYTVSPSSPDGSNGWYKADVTLTWTVTENESPGSLVKTGCVDQSITADQAETTYSCSAISDGGSAGPVSVSIKRDATAPTSVVTGFESGDVYYLGEALPSVSCTDADDLSGIATAGTLSGPTGTGPANPNGVGTFTFSCNGAADNAGNTQTVADTKTYTVLYDLSGTKILQPINPDNSSLFNRGKAVPVKFQLAGNNPYAMTGWKLLQQQVNCSLGGDSIGDSVEAVAENPSNSFRYDSTANQYIYNANFKDKTVGTCWKAGVQLDSGQTFWSAIFKLQK